MTPNATLFNVIFLNCITLSIVIFKFYYLGINKKPKDTLTSKHTINAKDLMSYCKKYPINNLPIVTSIPKPPQFPNVPSKDRAKHR